MIDKKLAIVIPAYKVTFFNECIRSISNQTNKNFTVYIGDDNSPHNLKKEVLTYSGLINIKYKRFKENLGKQNLVKHWERCLKLIDDEEWIWFFSDDDIMEKDCVECFYRELNRSSDLYDLYHFNVQIINEVNDVILTPRQFPDLVSVESFFKLKTIGKIKSYMVEYIFRKSAFYSNGGFEYFDLAWGTDDALWIKLSKKSGIKTIASSKVMWRKSSENISPNMNKNISFRKVEAIYKFFEWFKVYSKEKDIKVTKNLFLLGFLTTIRVPLSNFNVLKMVKEIERFDYSKSKKFVLLIYLFIYRFYKYLRTYVSK